jgi:hypothetical protein
MPTYRPSGELHTLVLSVRTGRSKRLWQRATTADIPALARFHNEHAANYQFAPVLSDAWLRKLPHRGLNLDDFWLLKDGTHLRGCVALWDQRRFKQTVVRGYRFPLNLLRAPYNAWALATGRLPLPAPGERLEQVFLAFAAFDSRAESIAIDALREALAHLKQKRAQAAVIGLSPTHSLYSRIVSAFPSHLYRTCIETVSWQGNAAPSLDGRAPQPETALL